MDWNFNEEKNAIVLATPSAHPKKITAGRLGTVLGLNAWQTPFQGWCDMTKVYKDPFVESKYTIAGKVIEPIIIEFMNKKFDGMVRGTEEFFGLKNPAQSFGYDFFKKEKIFGGMWDAVIVNNNGDIRTVIEIKTSSRPQDFVNGAPDEKKLQALLYGTKLKVKRTILVASFLEEEDYVHPELFVPTDENTKIYFYNTEKETVVFDGKKWTISDLLYYAEEWHKKYIKTGISPKFDEVRDKTILKALRTTKPDGDEFIESVDIVKLIEADEKKIAKIREKNKLDDLEKSLKNNKDALKRTMTEQLGKDDTSIVIKNWTLSKTTKTTVDSNALKADKLYEKYSKNSVSYTLRQSKDKETK